MCYKLDKIENKKFNINCLMVKFHDIFSSHLNPKSFVFYKIIIRDLVKWKNYTNAFGI